ncbi:MAG: hypothetical protein B7C24_17370 [Bacteroidetes bacterium 4572_77]|nr:MAG: hypothetical protein B7C24_17370 [Bacteroidetes bacterium 4572_77]
MKQINIITHNGLFHSDEVFAVAFLKHLFKEEILNISRTRDESLLQIAKADKHSYVLDLGGEYNAEMLNFDHHQDHYKGELSSFGLLIENLSQKQIISVFKYPQAFEYFKQQLVKPIDKWDNNTENVIQIAASNHIYSLQRIISAYNQSIPFGVKQEEAFAQAVSFAETIIKKEIYAAKEVHFEKLMCERYQADGHISINNKKAISKVFFSGFKGWAKQKGLRYMLIPVPNEELQNDYLVFSTKPAKYKLPIAANSYFRHKAGFIILFKSHENALQYFEKL